MNAPLVFIAAFVVGSSSLCADAADSFPELSKAFPTEELFNQLKLERIESYHYATDLAFADLKKKFTEFLGKGWSESKIDPKIEMSTHEALKPQGMSLEGRSLFSNPAFPGVQIALIQMKMGLEGKKFQANITVIRDKAEQGGADQPATAPEPKPEGEQKSKPESDVRPQ